MRIIAGQYRSRKLLSPPEGSTTRPMPDRVRESIFGILRGNIEGAAVLDVFAGTGSIGLEAISRGAARCVFVERDKRVAEMLKRNIETLGCGDRCEVAVGDALGLAVLARSPRPVDLIFFDPPYPMVEDATPGGGWERCRGQFMRLVDLLSDNGFAVLRTPWPFTHPDDPAAVAAPEESKPRRDRGDRERRRKGGRAGSRAWERDLDVGSGRRGGALDEEDDDFEEDAEHGEELDIGDLDEAEFEDEVDLGEEDLEGMDEDQEESEGALVTRHEVDLHLPNAIGPETHLYRHSALHLYMRRRDGAGAGGGAEGAG